MSTFDGMHLASEMILETCGGRVGNILNDSGEIDINQEIIIDSSFIRKVLGFEVDDTKIEEKLLLIGCKIKKIKNMMRVIPPSWRPDIKIKEDLVEEVGRLLGFENIPSKPFELNKQFERNVITFFSENKKAG